MKPLVFCLFAVCCWCLTEASADRLKQRRKLVEVHRQLMVVKDKLQGSVKMLRTPPENTEDCCCLSALKCFRANFKETFQTTERTHWTLYRSLNNSLTEKGLDFCNSQNTTCGDCNLHPKESAREFFYRLDSLIEKAIFKLRMK